MSIYRDSSSEASFVSPIQSSYTTIVKPFESQLIEELQLALRLLNRFAENDDFYSLIRLVFGEVAARSLTPDTFLALIEKHPDIQIRSSDELGNAYGAFSSETNAIYLADTLFSQTAQTSGIATRIIIEELGHYLDSAINEQDSPGDEGNIFASLVLGNAPNPQQLAILKQEDDSATLLLDNQLITVEQATISDSGGFEGSNQTLQLDSSKGSRLEYSFEFFFIPDQFIIRYEGQELLNTGFVSGFSTGEVQIPAGNSDQVQVIVATNDEGTLWNYSVTTTDCPNTSPWTIELAGGREFEDLDGDGDCDGDGTVYISYSDGQQNQRLLRIENTRAEYDSTSLRLTGGIFSLKFMVSVNLYLNFRVAQHFLLTTQSFHSVKSIEQMI